MAVVKHIGVSEVDALSVCCGKAGLITVAWMCCYARWDEINTGLVIVDWMCCYPRLGKLLSDGLMLPDKSVCCNGERASIHLTLKQWILHLLISVYPSRLQVELFCTMQVNGVHLISQ